MFELIKVHEGNVNNGVVDLCVVPACLDAEGKGGYIQKIMHAKLCTKWVSHSGAQHQV